MAYSSPYAKQRESFEEATRLLLDAKDGYLLQEFSINIVNGSGFAPDEVIVQFTGRISPETLHRLKAIMLAPYDDDRLDQIAREFPDTLHLKDA